MKKITKKELKAQIERRVRLYNELRAFHKKDLSIMGRTDEVSTRDEACMFMSCTRPTVRPNFIADHPSVYRFFNYAIQRDEIAEELKREKEESKRHRFSLYKVFKKLK